MIIGYRIAQGQYIDDLSGYGAYLIGGRWNLPGTYALYLASHRSLAYLEYLVHQYARDLWPTHLMISTIQINNDSLIHELAENELPTNWNSMKYNVEVQQVAGRFFALDVLGIKVPSIVVPGEHNYVLNPGYVNYKKEVSSLEITAADFDERLKPSK